jgi:ribonucleoside-diphosphate reductase alpha chain
VPYAPFETSFAHSVADEKYMAPNGDKHWGQTALRVTYAPTNVARDETPGGKKVFTERQQSAIFDRVSARHFIPGGRYLAQAGRDYHQVQNCLLLDVEDTREGWADLTHKTFMALMSGAGIGVYYGKLREHGALIKRTGGIASGPTPLAIAVNEQSRAAVSGGNRRAAIWGGLLWSHPDIFTWMGAKDWPDYIVEQKIKDPWNTPAPLDMTNISVCLDDEFFYAMSHKTRDLATAAGKQTAPDGGTWEAWAKRVYWEAIRRMVTKGEPGFSIDLGDKRDEKLRNACTEITSADDSDICNLGGLVLPRFSDPKEFGKAVRDGALYLLAGTVYSDVPYDRVAEIREKNRRLGLDIMGVHEFLLMRGLRYGSDEGFEALEPFMVEYDRALEYAADWADKLGISRPVAATAGSPTGTRGIVAETTTSWQSVVYRAYRRGVLNSGGAGGNVNRSEVVVDPTVLRLVKDGWIGPTDPVEDSTTIHYENLFRMQAYAQSHTDHAISMTLNLPHQMFDKAEQKAFGDTLYKYLPQMRGTTVYPDGAIPGQPIQQVPLSEALGEDFVVYEDDEKCATGVCGV